jgi:aspartyl protease family protein
MARILVALACLLTCGAAAALEVNVVALTAGKAVVVVGKGKPQTLAVGQSTREGVKLVRATSESATFEIGGELRTLRPGEGAALAVLSAPREAAAATLTADSRGHFFAEGAVNGVAMRFMVDTGATAITMSGAAAKRAGVNYLGGTRMFTQTANGIVPVYHVKLDSVTVGGITLHNVDAVVIEGDTLPVALLGLSFLNRTEMKRDGETMTLIRRY